MTSPADILAMAQATEIFLNHKIIDFGTAAGIARKMFDIGDAVVFTHTDLHFLPTKGDSFPFRVPIWTDDAMEPELERYGKDVVAFVKTKPTPGTSMYDHQSECWVVCAVRGCVMPSKDTPKEGPKKESPSKPEATETNPGATTKPRRGRPPKAASEPKEETPPAADENGDDDIPFK